nr:hypothetical protein [Tanacetum cinerariifolium]
MEILPESTSNSSAVAGSESRPPMLNKENYVPWSSRLLRYAKSRPNGKLIHNSILNGPYVRRMIPEPGDANRKVSVTETFHLQTDDELSDKELKQIEADDQAIQTILLGLPEDIYAAEKKAKLFNEWERFTSNEGESIESYYHRFLKLMNDLKTNKHFPEKIASNLKFLNNLQPEWSRHYNQKDVDELKAKQLAKTQDPLSLMANSNNPYVFPTPHQDQSSFNQNYLQQQMMNPKDITDPTTAMNMALALMAKAFKLNYSTPTNNNKRISSNLKNRQIAQPGMNMARAEGNLAGKNGNQIRCYNCRGVGHYVRNCTVRPRRRDAAYLQTELLIAQKEEAGIQLQAEEYDLMVAAVDLDEIEEVNANCILMANLQQASTSGTQTDSAPVYDIDGSVEVHENCDDNEIFNMFTQEEQYTELLEPILESHQIDLVVSLFIRFGCSCSIRFDCLVDKAILSGAENRPPMLEKDMYDSWRSRMEMYMLNRQHAAEAIQADCDVKATNIILQALPPEIYAVFTAEAIQADCDVKATNIILQALPPEIYAVFSTHKVAKDL